MTKEECYIFMKKIHVNQKVAASNRAGAQNVAGALSMDQARGRLRGNLSQAMANIQLHNYIKAIEMVLNDVKLDPFILVSKLLTTYYSGMEKVKFDDFKKFFNRFESYFIKSDIVMFLREAELLVRRDQLISIDEIACMIRNDIECMPK